MSMEDLQKHYARQALQNQGPFNLQHTIEDPSCLKYLKRFCKEADLSEEILLAFLDIQMFNQLPKGEQRTSMASRIVDDYFEDGAPMLVGLSEKHRRDVISKLTREGGPQDDGLQQVEGSNPFGHPCMQSTRLEQSGVAPAGVRAFEGHPFQRHLPTICYIALLQ